MGGCSRVAAPSAIPGQRVQTVHCGSAPPTRAAAHALRLPRTRPLEQAPCYLATLLSCTLGRALGEHLLANESCGIPPCPWAGRLGPLDSRSPSIKPHEARIALPYPRKRYGLTAHPSCVVVDVVSCYAREDFLEHREAPMERIFIFAVGEVPCGRASGSVRNVVELRWELFWAARRLMLTGRSYGRRSGQAEGGGSRFELG